MKNILILQKPLQMGFEALEKQLLLYSLAHTKFLHKQIFKHTAKNSNIFMTPICLKYDNFEAHQKMK